MKLIVGLGNPGQKYHANRHNVGFLALDRIAADHGFAPWRARFQGEISEGKLGDERALLLKPATFMNLSGQSVGEAMRYLRIEPGDVIVLHDELDLAPGKVRLKAGGGHAGHNGLRSIHQHIGEAYRRLRIGIGHPGHKDRVAGYVLSDFAKDEAAGLDELLRAISEGAVALASGDDAAFMQAIAARMAPPRNSGTRPPLREAPAPKAAPADAPAKPTMKPTAAPTTEPSVAERLRILAERFQ